MFYVQAGEAMWKSRSGRGRGGGGAGGRTRRESEAAAACAVPRVIRGAQPGERDRPSAAARARPAGGDLAIRILHTDRRRSAAACTRYRTGGGHEQRPRAPAAWARPVPRVGRLAFDLFPARADPRGGACSLHLFSTSTDSGLQVFTARSDFLMRERFFDVLGRGSISNLNDSIVTCYLVKSGISMRYIITYCIFSEVSATLTVPPDAAIPPSRHFMNFD
ncbi:hypothetical protein EVAR_102735_1 [Eumeta japonica]|uniref:Uncharacterized protein n=1 Tax=Eumeta variegata TaxID=151549 RepID=A0A4C1THU4_EUMVA|nr:hypothetical protein EVAR_102735_1 [Eumeta japonica]